MTSPNIVTSSWDTLYTTKVCWFSSTLIWKSNWKKIQNSPFPYFLNTMRDTAYVSAVIKCSSGRECQVYRQWQVCRRAEFGYLEHFVTGLIWRMLLKARKGELYVSYYWTYTVSSAVNPRRRIEPGTINCWDVGEDNGIFEVETWRGGESNKWFVWAL
jgi:hypothetical protein